ncbi:MAG: hypothetical protein GY941_16425 [Planctomycetes bacterium]|nr:hypothetical protein [Planctomycetota bacterium]
MKFIKLTLLEANCVLDCLKEESTETEEAIELLSEAIEKAVDEVIPSECDYNSFSSREG